MVEQQEMEQQLHSSAVVAIPSNAEDLDESSSEEPEAAGVSGASSEIVGREAEMTEHVGNDTSAPGSTFQGFLQKQLM